MSFILTETLVCRSLNSFVEYLCNTKFTTEMYPIQWDTNHGKQVSYLVNILKKMEMTAIMRTKRFLLISYQRGSRAKWQEKPNPSFTETYCTFHEHRPNMSVSLFNNIGNMIFSILENPYFGDVIIDLKEAKSYSVQNFFSKSTNKTIQVAIDHAKQNFNDKLNAELMFAIKVGCNANFFSKTYNLTFRAIMEIGFSFYKSNVNPKNFKYIVYVASDTNEFQNYISLYVNKRQFKQNVLLLAIPDYNELLLFYLAHSDKNIRAIDITIGLD